VIAAIAQAVAAAFQALLAWLQKKRDDLLVSLGAAQERNKAAEANAETQEALKEVADERSSIPDAATDPDDLARELRRQKSGAGGSGRKRPF
jgi:acyl-CoA reductase-like NAD-dependent aldehyde dehydrogenase